MTFRNILVPYDGSKYSLHAFKTALEAAQKYESKITILTCLLKPAYRGIWYQDSRYTKAILKQEEKYAKENISKLLESVSKTDVHITSKIIPTTHVADQITSFAKSHKIDLIVMGSHGRTGFGKVLLGSVAQSISEKSPCTVMITKK